MRLPGETMPSRSPTKEPIKVERLSAYYGKLRAVYDVSFSLKSGQTLALVGESGSGKSTIALALADALEGKVEGKIIRQGELAMVFQDPSTALNPVYTIGWQLLETIWVKLKLDEEAAYKKAISMLQEVGLPSPEIIFEKYPHELSGGQRQRAMIAMALVGDPEVLIADEPTTALDVTVQLEVLSLLKRLQKERGMALLLITHDMGVVEKMADRVMVLYAGEMVEEGSVDEVMKHPKHPYTEALIEASFLEVDDNGRLLAIEGSVPALGKEPSGCRFHPRCPYAFEKCLKEPVPLFKNVRCFLYEGDKRPPKQEGILRKESRYFQPLSEKDPILVVEHLSKRFPIYSGFFRGISGWSQAVDDVSFEVNRNEVVGIVGESGSGKTTLGKMIAGLIAPTSGVIKQNVPPQMIFQDPGTAMNPRHTIGEALIEPLLYWKLEPSPEEAKKKALSLLEKMGFGDEVFVRYPHEFSLGQKQRLAVARSLLLNPELIICDEPVSALDVSVQAQILNLFSELKSAYATSLLFISHDLNVVRFIASRVLVMKEGKIVESGTVEEVFERPKHAYTEKLIEGALLNAL